MSELRQGNTASLITNMMSGRDAWKSVKYVGFVKRIAGDESRRITLQYLEKVKYIF